MPFQPFVASSPLSGIELWSTDGTAAKTALVPLSTGGSEINPGTGNANPANFVVAAGKTFFTATDGAGNTELYVFDNAANTDTRLDKLAIGTAGYTGVVPSSITAVGARVLFVASNALTGAELWSTDGTPANTALVPLASGGSEINPGTPSSNPANFAVSGTKAFFTATDGAGNTELYVYDSAANTDTRLDKLALGTAGYTNVVGSSITVVGNRVLFLATTPLAGAELWSTDGTAAGTALVPLASGGSEINPGTPSANPANIVVAGTKAFFTATDGSGNTELYVYDSAANTDTRLDKLALGTAGYTSVVPSSIVVAGNRIIFVATTALTGAELWSTDGTAAGTALVPLATGGNEINPGTGSANPTVFFPLNNGALFTATDGAGNTELYFYNSAAQNSTRLDKLPSGTAGYTGVVPSSIVLVSTRALFVASNALTGAELWSTDGTAAGTALVPLATGGNEINPGTPSANPANIVVSAGKAFFTATDGAGNTELYVYDDATNTDTRLDKLPIGTAGYTGVVASSITVVGNRVLFVASNALTGAELWSTDGTAANTALVPLASGGSEINPGAGGANPGSIVVSGTKAYFTATDGAGNTELYIYDSAANTDTRMDKLPAGTASYAAPAIPPVTSYAVAATDASRAVKTAGGLPFTFTVTRTGDSTAAATLIYAVTGAGATPVTAANFVGGVLPTGFISFAAGETSKAISVNVAANPTLAQTQTFQVSLSLPNGTSPGLASLVTPTASGSIQASVVPITYSIAPLAATLSDKVTGTTPYTFTVTRTGDATAAATLTFAVAGSGANPAPATLLATTSGTVTFAAGSTTAIVTVNVNGARITKGSDFTTTLSGPAGTTITTATATGTVLPPVAVVLNNGDGTTSNYQYNLNDTVFSTITRTNGSGAVISNIIDNFDSTSLLYTYNISSTVTQTTSKYSGTDLTNGAPSGTKLSDVVNNKDGTTLIYAYNPTSTVSQTTSKFSGTDPTNGAPTGARISDVVDNTDGTSLLYAYNPSATVTQTTSRYSATDPTNGAPAGTLIATVVDNKDGTALIYAYNLTSTITQTATLFSATDPTNGAPAGSKLTVVFDYSNGTSAVQAFKADGTSTTTNYSGSGGTGKIITASQAPADPTTFTVSDAAIASPTDTAMQFLTVTPDQAITLTPGAAESLAGFDTATNALDFSLLLGAAGITSGTIGQTVGSFVTITDQSADALVQFDPAGHAAGSTVAILQGLGTSVTNPGDLLLRGF